jgi:hypothetical protein
MLYQILSQDGDELRVVFVLLSFENDEQLLVLREIMVS